MDLSLFSSALTVGQMIIDYADGLEEGIGDYRADIADTAFFHILMLFVHLCFLLNTLLIYCTPISHVLPRKTQ